MAKERDITLYENRSYDFIVTILKGAEDWQDLEINVSLFYSMSTIIEKPCTVHYGSNVITWSFTPTETKEFRLFNAEIEYELVAFNPDYSIVQTIMYGKFKIKGSLKTFT